MPGNELRLSDTPNALPGLIKEIRKLKGMTQADLNKAIGDLFTALGGDLYIEYRQK